ncbi:MAG: hypothetical protein D3923_01905 [Candidatus Electrothrix sp. AR3]|nr:hypothetical protein [Candidatus Electrothrix sp. AR3]
MSEFFELDSDESKSITHYVTENFDKAIGWPNICHSMDSVTEILKRIASNNKDLIVLCLGLHREFIAEFCAIAEPEQQEGYAPVGRQGVHEKILENEPIAGNIKFLGFEPLVFNYALSCSWLCNHLEKDVFDTFNIKTNKYGLVETFGDAIKCTQYFNSDKVGAEPGLWLPWALFSCNCL